MAIASTEPLGGPAAGGTVVTVRGSGFVDRGGVYCRFGRSAAADAACDACSEQFEAAGGCPALLSGNAISQMLPDGCESCLTVATVWCQREAMVAPATLRSATELVCVSPAMAVGAGKSFAASTELPPIMVVVMARTCVLLNTTYLKSLDRPAAEVPRSEDSPDKELRGRQLSVFILEHSAL